MYTCLEVTYSQVTSLDVKLTSMSFEEVTESLKMRFCNLPKTIQFCTSSSGNDLFSTP